MSITGEFGANQRKKKGVRRFTRKEIQERYRIRNADKIKAQGRQYKLLNRDKISARERIRRNNNPKPLKVIQLPLFILSREYRMKEIMARQRRRYRLDFKYKDRMILRAKKRASVNENKPKINFTKSNWTKDRYEKDPLFRIKLVCRRRIFMSIKNMGWKKTTKTHDLLGCSYEFYVQWLEQKFMPGMSWDNHGLWHVDHIIPLCSAKTEKELVMLFHYSNTQPLWAIDNLKKGGKQW